jgi:general secretion pathway protein A
MIQSTAARIREPKPRAAHSLELFHPAKLCRPWLPMGHLKPTIAFGAQMYETRFGLKRRPFPATPDSALYYPATPHEAALAALARAVDEDAGLSLLTGAPGTGKTLVAHLLLERLGEGAVSAFLTNSHFPDRAALLQTILFDLGLPYDQGGEQALRLRLTEALLKNCADGKRNLIVVDEAHLLSPDLLEELRLLGNLEAGGRKAFQAVCLAQPKVVETLQQPRLAGWKQRLGVQAALEPLSALEACDYLLHHLRQAGAKAERVIDEAGLETLARGTHGTPRLLNQAAHRALVLADAADMDCVDAEAAIEALASLGLQVDDEAADAPLGIAA